MMDKKIIRTVMLLNDQKEATVLNQLLKNFKLNLDIIVAQDLKHFISVSTNEEIQLFILEWDYQEIKIAELIKQIRKNNQYRKTPVVLVTDQNDQNISLEYSALNIDLIITRPFEKDNFKDKFKDKLIHILEKKLGTVIPNQYKILIVDDDPSIIEILKEYLKQLKHKNYVACVNLVEAKKYVDQFDYDLMLLDWNLPDGTCIELIDYVRLKKDRARLSQALIIVVTGRDDVDSIMTLLKHNINDQIIKPFDFIEFEDKIIYALEKHLKNGMEKL